MGTEDWVFKGTKFITYTKKQRLKIQSLDFQKYNIKEKKKKKKEKSHKNYETTTTTNIYIYIYTHMAFALRT